MIRKLQKRFVKIAVLALTLAMVLVVVIVNAANLVSVRNELTGTLRLLAENIVPANPPAEMANPGETGWNREAGKSADAVPGFRPHGLARTEDPAHGAGRSAFLARAALAHGGSLRLDDGGPAVGPYYPRDLFHLITLRKTSVRRSRRG